MVKFVFLDLDDTILDFHKAEAEALKDTLLHMGVSPTDAVVARYSEINDAQWKRLERGEMTREQVKLRRFQILFEELGIERDAEQTRRYYENRLGIGHFFLSGAEEMLRALDGRYRLFIMSNGTTSVQNGRIASAGIAPLFEQIFLSEAIGYVKPQKEFFDACFAAIPDFDPAQAIILGDSLTSDIQGGIYAGIRTCWFNPHGKAGRADIKADYEVHTLADFVDLLDHVE